VNGVIPRISSVARSETSSGVSWLLSVSSQDCRPPNLDFSVDLSAADASADATVTRVHDHAPALTGEVVVEFKGEFARFSPYASGTLIPKPLTFNPEPQIRNPKERMTYTRDRTCRAFPPVPIIL